ncbi:MAG: Hsp20/alpha crystallin family protein [Chloroflexota bacterium]|nr:MAG: molecular chaperone [Chloroflexota bacterium]
MTRHQTVRVIAIRHPFAAFEARAWRPPLNVYELRDGLMLVVELAGVDANGLHVHVHPSQVIVHGERRLSAPQGLQRVHRMEIGSGPFYIEVPLGTPVNPDGAEARYSDGMLEVWLPFAQQPAQRVVVVQIGGGS